MLSAAIYDKVAGDAWLQCSVRCKATIESQMRACLSIPLGNELSHSLKIGTFGHISPCLLECHRFSSVRQRPSFQASLCLVFRCSVRTLCSTPYASVQRRSCTLLSTFRLVGWKVQFSRKLACLAESLEKFRFSVRLFHRHNRVPLCDLFHRHIRVPSVTFLIGIKLQISLGFDDLFDMVYSVGFSLTY